jgi:hypothetical protein
MIGMNTVAKNKKLNQAFEQYGTSCPFELAQHLQVKVNYHDFPEHIYGLYSPMLSTAHVLINEKLSLEKQEKVCDHFVAHHILFETCAAAFCIDHTTFLELEKKKGSSPNTTMHKKIISITK